jgi:hypothetical protein
MYVRDPGPEGGPASLEPAEALGITIAAASTLWIGLFPSALLALTQRLV